MSLTRKELEDMYESIKHIERLADFLYFSHRLRSDEIKRECKFLKDKIEFVIGQQE